MEGEKGRGRERLEEDFECARIASPIRDFTLGTCLPCSSLCAVLRLRSYAQEKMHIIGILLGMDVWVVRIWDFGRASAITSEYGVLESSHM